jgi:hypothetical protein
MRLFYVLVQYGLAVEPVRTIKRQYIYSLMEGSEVVRAFERNNAGLKKLSSFV